MAVGVFQEFEATVEQYDAVNEKIQAGGDPPQGLILHTGSDLGGGMMRVYDVWESEEAWNKFRDERLGPAVAEVAGPDAPPPTKMEVHELHDLIKP